MLSKETTKLVSLFIVIFLIGLALGNSIILSMSLIPLFTVLVGLLFRRPDNVEIKEVQRKGPSWVGEVDTLSFDVVIKDGIGVVAVAQQLPVNFQVLEGNNFGIYWKGRGEKSFSLSCKVKCSKRGSYSMPPAQWEAQHPLGLVPTKRQSSGTKVEMTVSPKILNVKRIRGMPGIASTPFPEIDIAKIGLATTDFREIRKYVYGDPIKAINWKATARQARRGIIWPLVNEYEAEGKKTLWIFLDGSIYMNVGTVTESVFERAVEAADAVAFYFLDRGYRVGMYIYNDGGRLFYPDAGRKQFYRLTRELVGLKTAPRFDELPEAVEKCRRYILGYKPLCVIVTRLDSRYSGLVVEGTKKIRALRSRWRRAKLPVMVVSIAGYEAIGRKNEYEDNAAAILYLETRPVVESLRRLGASILEWNPRTEGFATALLKQVRAK